MISVDPLFYAEFSDRFRQNSEAVQQFSCQGGQFQAPQLHAFLWGCGAGAIVVGVSSEKNCIIRYEGFGSRRIKKDSYGIGENTNKEGFTALDGKAIYMFAVSEIPKFMKQFVSKCGLSLTDIDVIVPHQPNPRILEKLIERLGIRPDKMLVSCDQLGNMIGASVPITYHLNRQSGKIKRGSKVLFCSFGDSYLTGAAILFDEF
jgi:3-oxoacyl-[acyl-carrier-protein] synthase-3